jgi:hypothetical protein
MKSPFYGERGSASHKKLAVTSISLFNASLFGQYLEIHEAFDKSKYIRMSPRLRRGFQPLFQALRIPRRRGRDCCSMSLHGHSRKSCPRFRQFHGWRKSLNIPFKRTLHCHNTRYLMMRALNPSLFGTTEVGSVGPLACIDIL